MIEKTSVLKKEKMVIIGFVLFFILAMPGNASTGHSVLIIDDDDDINSSDDQSVGIFASVFKDNRYNVTIERSSATSNVTWSNYDIVIWSCGDDYSPVNDPQYKSMLVDHVARGGRLILESGYIASWINQHGNHAIDSEFRENVLHATSDWIYSDVRNMTLSAKHPVATAPNALPETIGFTPENPGDDSGDSDAVRILPDATGVYSWSYVAYMGKPVPKSISDVSFGLIAYDNDEILTNGGQEIYFSFDIDDIDSPDIQKKLIENSLNWLNKTSTKPPIADCGPDILKCENAGVPVQFNASASYDPDGTIISYNWEFGDGTNGTGVAPKHIYESYRWNGSQYMPFIANLTVTDNSASTNRTSQKVVVWMPCDTTGDGRANILDASVIGLRWRSADACADTNNDGRVDILDAACIGRIWGKTA